jgi:hypothetical protein
VPRQTALEHGFYTVIGRVAPLYFLVGRLQAESLIILRHQLIIDDNPLGSGDLILTPCVLKLPDYLFHVWRVGVSAHQLAGVVPRLGAGLTPVLGLALYEALVWMRLNFT